MEKFFLKKTLYSPKETEEIGVLFAKKIVASKPLNTARVFLLRGNLGAGKTTFTRGFVGGLNIKKKTTSPTFILLRRFSIPNSLYKNFFHIDAYRLNSPSEANSFQLHEIIQNPQNIVFIEWPEKIKLKKTDTCGVITLKHKTESIRNISISLFK